MSKRFCIFQPQLNKKHSEESGSSTAIIEYDDNGKIVGSGTGVIDTGSADSDALDAYNKIGITEIEYVILTHPHEDHMGYFERMAKMFKIKSVYLPSTEAYKAHSTVKGRANYIESIRKKAIAECGEKNVHYMKMGDSFKTASGNVSVDCIFQADYKKLKEVDSHHYPNNLSLGTLITMTDIYGRSWTYYGCGDAAKEANQQFVEKYKKKPLEPDFAHVQWHGDPNASGAEYCKALAPQYAFMDYRHSYKPGGRTITIDKFNQAGCRVLGTYLYGDIYADIYDEGHCYIHADKGLTKIKWMKHKAKVQTLNDMQITAYACLVFAGTYGKDPERAAQLKVRFGEKNAKLIQNRVNVLAKDSKALKYAFAASIFNSYFGSGDARKKNLGNYAKIGQDAVDEIHKRKIIDYDALAKEIKAGKWGDCPGVIRVLTNYKKYSWLEIQSACAKIGVNLGIYK